VPPIVRKNEPDTYPLECPECNRLRVLPAETRLNGGASYGATKQVIAFDQHRRVTENLGYNINAGSGPRMGNDGDDW